MQVAYHGGQCCGIKVIYGFSSNPREVLGKVVANPISSVQAYSLQNKDRRGATVSSDLNPCLKDFPAQTGIERLDALVEWVKEWRPEGIIEITLTDAYQKKWYPLLKSRKFKQVAKFYNSNSGNIVRIFHLIYGEANEELKKRKKRPSKQAAPWSVS